MQRDVTNQSPILIPSSDTTTINYWTAAFSSVTPQDAQNRNTAVTRNDTEPASFNSSLDLKAAPCFIYECKQARGVWLQDYSENTEKMSCLSFLYKKKCEGQSHEGE